MLSRLISVKEQRHPSHYPVIKVLTASKLVHLANQDDDKDAHLFLLAADIQSNPTI